MSVPEVLTRTSLAAAIARKVGNSSVAALRFLNEILALISQSCSQNECVKIPHFGTFYLIDKGARQSRHPRTGEMQQIQARRILRLRASQALCQQVSGTTSGVGLRAPRGDPGSRRKGPRVSANVRSTASEARAHVVMRHIHVVRKDGAVSLRQIAAALDARGIATPRGGKWGASQVQAVLARAEVDKASD